MADRYPAPEGPVVAGPPYPAPPAPGWAPAPQPAGPAPTAATPMAAAPMAPAPGPASVAPPPPSRRGLRAALRWTAAVLVFAALGGATAYAVTLPDRTTLPGLKTPGDGRWTYPPLTLPKLPPGRPAPLDDTRNRGGHHYTDLRSLLLPMPQGATADPAFPGAKGWLPANRFLAASHVNTREEWARLRQDGLRHVAARAWTTPDGVRTEIYLVQFVTWGWANTYAQWAQDQQPFVADPARPGTTVPADTEPDSTLQSGALPSGVNLYAFTEKKPKGVTARYSYIVAGDTVGFVTQTRTTGTTPYVPFQQTVTLQSQLLG